MSAFGVFPVSPEPRGVRAIQQSEPPNSSRFFSCLFPAFGFTQCTFSSCHLQTHPVFASKLKEKSEEEWLGINACNLVCLSSCPCHFLFFLDCKCWRQRILPLKTLTGFSSVQCFGCTFLSYIFFVVVVPGPLSFCCSYLLLWIDRRPPLLLSQGEEVGVI